jgi:hypothetical protein
MDGACRLEGAEEKLGVKRCTLGTMTFPLRQWFYGQICHFRVDCS